MRGQGDTRGGTTVELGVRGGWTVVAVHGELDVRAAPELVRAAEAGLRAAAPAVCVDLRAATFVDSLGLAALIRIRRRVHHARGRLVLLVGDGAVGAFIARTRMDRVFELVAELPGAAAAA